MKKRAFIRFMLAIVTAVIMAKTAAAYNLSFTFYNNSGWDFKQIWLKPRR